MKPPARHSAIRGFSLTETTLALAILGFSLVSLLGLLSVSMTTAKESAQETYFASAARQVVDGLRAVAFRDIPYAEPSSGSSAPAGVELPTVYFDENGQWLAPDRASWLTTPDSATPPPGATYRCDVIVAPDLHTLTPASLALPQDSARVNLLRIAITITPLGTGGPDTAAGKRDSAVFHVTLARQ
jgi:uncharacterized protein (TIGR02598 family)